MGQPVDFVGLNTFIYEPFGYDPDEQTWTYVASTFTASEGLSLGLGHNSKVYLNHVGMLSYSPSVLKDLYFYKNYKFSLDGATNASLPGSSQEATASLFVALMLHRNGPYGWPTWKQIRASQNPLIRKQKKHNIFTYVQEPGEEIEYIASSGASIKFRKRFSDIKKHTEDPLVAKYKPLRLVGLIEDEDQQKRSVEIEAVLGNEMVYFDNKEPNSYFNVSLNESEGYRMIKRMYLHGALDSESSVMEAFSFLEYSETIYPALENTYRNYVRARPNFDFPWRDDIKKRIKPGVSKTDDVLYSDPGTIDNGFDFEVPYQSRWPLDAGWNFDAWSPKEDGDYLASGSAPNNGQDSFDDYFRFKGTRKSIDSGSIYFFPIGGKAPFGDFDDGQGGLVQSSSYNYRTSLYATDSAGGEGQLMNSYSMFADWRQLTNSSGVVSSIDLLLTASATYSRKHIIPSPRAIVHKGGMPIPETSSYIPPGAVDETQIHFFDIEQYFGGRAKWQANELRMTRNSENNLISSPRNPFDDTYEKFSVYTRLVGKDYSIAPEFRISNHVETYESISSKKDNLQLFEVSGGLSGSSDSSESNFYKVYSNSDFMKHFKMIEKDHKDFVEPSAITLECNAIKNFLPYEGFYPAQRCLDLGKQFYKSYGKYFQNIDCSLDHSEFSNIIKAKEASVKLRFHGPQFNYYYYGPYTGTPAQFTENLAGDYRAIWSVPKYENTGSSNLYKTYWQIEYGADSYQHFCNPNNLDYANIANHPDFLPIKTNISNTTQREGQVGGTIICDANGNCVFFAYISENYWYPDDITNQQALWRPDFPEPCGQGTATVVDRDYLFPCDVHGKPLLIGVAGTSWSTSLGEKWTQEWQDAWKARATTNSDQLVTEPVYIPVVYIKANKGSQNTTANTAKNVAKNLRAAINALHHNELSGSNGSGPTNRLLEFFGGTLNTTYQPDYEKKYGNGVAAFALTASYYPAESATSPNDQDWFVEIKDTSGLDMELHQRIVSNFSSGISVSKPVPQDERQMMDPWLACSALDFVIQNPLQSSGDEFLANILNGKFTLSSSLELPITSLLDCDESKYTKIQPIITPLFAPGVLFNTIKSGVACDYPLMTDNIKRVLGTVKTVDKDGNEETGSFWMIGCRGTNTSSFVGTDDWFQNPIPTSPNLALTASEWTSSDGGISDYNSLSVLALKKNDNLGSFRGFNLRIPFEALIEPENHLANVTLINQEPDNFLYFHEYVRLNYKSRWDGQGDLTYKKMAHNFLAEVPEFFLVNKGFKQIKSMAQGNPNFGNVLPAPTGDTAEMEYKMRVKMYRSLDKPKNTIFSNGVSVAPPQDYLPLNSVVHPRETITMYSRPSAFGPPSWDGDFEVKYLNSSDHIVSGSDNRYGYNFPFTPPYYHGDAWADITFKPFDGVRKYTLEEILNNCTTQYYRYWHPMANIYLQEREKNTSSEMIWTSWTGSLSITSSTTGSTVGPNDPDYPEYVRLTGNFYGPQHPLFVNDNAMQLDASLNLFGKLEESTNSATDLNLGFFGQQQINVETIDQNKSKWVIQPKFETPILNFNHITASGQQQIEKLVVSNAALHTLSFDTSVLFQGNYVYIDNRIQLFDGSKEFNVWFDTGVGIDPATEGHPNTVKVDVSGVSTDTEVRDRIFNAIRASSSFEVSTLTENGNPGIAISSSYLGPSLSGGFGSATSLANYMTLANVQTGSNSDLTLDPRLRATTTRGMWHQYGLMPSGSEGVYLRIEDVPKTWMKGALGVHTAKAQNTGSLADLVGFSKEPVRLGEISPTKEISEAVVAVPFLEKKGRRNFFSIPRRDIGNALEEAPETRWVGSSIVAMVEKMQRYVFPPSMDFISNKDIAPFAMYIFEFKHMLSKQDLADIWQNLPPDIGTSFEMATSSISHELLSTELLGGGTKDETVPVPLQRNKAKGDPLPDRLKWMVFKVKQKAKTNYYDKVVQKAGISDEEEAVKLSKASFNWPYDFFSLIELVKLDASITFSDVEEDDAEGSKVVKPKVATTIINRELGRGQLFKNTPEDKVKDSKAIKQKVDEAVANIKPKGFF
jgi:hypothetical protein